MVLGLGKPLEMYYCTFCKVYHKGEAPYVIKDLDNSFSIGWCCRKAYVVFQTVDKSKYPFDIIKHYPRS